jgi:hypothetical protein
LFERISHGTVFFSHNKSANSTFSHDLSVFFSHNKSANSTFSHGLSAKRTGLWWINLTPLSMRRETDKQAAQATEETSSGERSECSPAPWGDPVVIAAPEETA